MQLKNLSTYHSQEELVFSEPKGYNVKNSKITYERIHLSTKYQKGNGPLVIETPLLFSFGVPEKETLKKKII